MLLYVCIAFYALFFIFETGYPELIHRPGWTWAHGDPDSSASSVLGLKAWDTWPSLSLRPADRKDSNSKSCVTNIDIVLLFASFVFVLFNWKIVWDVLQGVLKYVYIVKWLHRTNRSHLSLLPPLSPLLFPIPSLPPSPPLSKTKKQKSTPI